MHVFRHPKYYEEFRQRAKRYQKELRERNKEEARAQLKVPSSNLDQVISDEASTEATSVQPGPGHKQQASSSKRQATSDKPQAPSDSKTLEQDS
jgi:hypothetical protein